MELTAGDRLAAWLLLITGAAHAALGAAAIAGLSSFESNVEEIETSFQVGLFSSLGAWGALLAMIGVGEMLSARAIRADSANGWLAGQLSAFVALGGIFFTLGIFRLAGALTIPLLLAILYLLAHHSSRSP